jgi:hypothetical protein
VKNNQQAKLRERRRTLSSVQQNDLLRKLLAPEDILKGSNLVTSKTQRILHKNEEQDSRLLEELLVETPIP